MKRDGFVYSLYLKNIRNQTLLTILIVGLYIWALQDYRKTPPDNGEGVLGILCFYTVVTLALVVLTALFLAKPALHPTYRQLNQYGPDVRMVAAQIDAEYESSGVSRDANDKKTLYLDSWLVRRSAFFNTIRKKPAGREVYP